ncbi:hypothetical protein [Candidatus Pelagibacter sp. Uisw_134_02]|uniref:hypothetical protein n=1 Tax=Candidatus Pelagibacter sp. Uisw_134_02 TaxID=3230990 RepID=UPI0039ED4F44
MKKLLLIFILTFSFNILTKADDIRDFEIEGMSIGDSLLDYFSKSLIDNKKKFPSWPNKKFTRFQSEKNLDTYDAILFYFEDNGDYLISSISAITHFSDIDNCYKKKITVIKDLKNTFTNYEIHSYKNDHHQDKTGKSINDITDFDFSSGASSRVICTDWSKDMQFEDELRVILSSKEYSYFITNEAFN